MGCARSFEIKTSLIFEAFRIDLNATNNTCPALRTLTGEAELNRIVKESVCPIRSHVSTRKE